MKRIRFLLILPIVFFLAACAYNAQIAEDAYNALKESSIAYDTSLKISAELYNNGFISEGDKNEIIKVMKVYYDAHNVSVIILGEYGKYTIPQLDDIKVKSPECYFEEDK